MAPEVEQQRERGKGKTGIESGQDRTELPAENTQGQRQQSGNQEYPVEKGELVPEIVLVPGGIQIVGGVAGLCLIHVIGATCGGSFYDVPIGS
jgi:hypothetical protein